MKNYLQFYVLLCFGIMSFAQEDVSSKEAGVYQRKSVAFLNLAINKSEVVGSEWKDDLVSVLQNSVKFERFDYNNVPQSAVDKFSALPASIPLEERMNRTVVPAILSAVDAQKEIRAMDLLSEQQKNSFITDKAKELGITEEELNTVMNSAYIFAPVYIGYTDSSYATQSYGTAYKITLSAGGYWWKIDNTGKKPAAKLVANIERTYSSTKYSGEEYRFNGQKINPKYAAFREALNLIATDVQAATRAIPDFQLSAQVLDRNPRNVVISIGKRDGIKTDDKFWVYESLEDAEGNITQKKRGWVMVKKVGEKARGLDASQSQAQIISGLPYVGSTIKEIPQLPLDITVGFTQIPFDVDNKGQREYDAKIEEIKNSENNKMPQDTIGYGERYIGGIRHLKLSNMYGPKLKMSVNLFTSAGGSQWWFNAGGEFLFGKASGEFYYNPYSSNSGRTWYDIDALALGFGAEFSLAKKIFIRRFVLAPEIGFGIKDVMLHNKDDKEILYDIYISQFSLGLLGNMGVEFAITPTVHLGASAGYHLFTKSDTWNSRWRYNKKQISDTTSYRDGPNVKSGDLLKTSGMTWSAYVSFALPYKSKKSNDLVTEKDVPAVKTESEDEQSEDMQSTVYSNENDKYKNNNEINKSEVKKQKSGGGGFWRFLLGE
ncbi:MAG: hypothetical protein LBH98_06775 [Chitinispirillales bacterium]|jgi:hypothetical protein|nr:hypothetical protein [Chitinispirillales bacterium]